MFLLLPYDHDVCFERKQVKMLMPTLTKSQTFEVATHLLVGFWGVARNPPRMMMSHHCHSRDQTCTAFWIVCICRTLPFFQLNKKAQRSKTTTAKHSKRSHPSSVSIIANTLGQKKEVKKGRLALKTKCPCCTRHTLP